MSDSKTVLDKLRGLVWRDSTYLSALSDDERHYGHAVRNEKWQAFDATRSNDAGDGFKYLGYFDTREEAKAAVEDATRGLRRPQVVSASVH